jgi:APA family basic amino acid/polyamine antiporter
MASVFLALMPGISRIYVAMARDGILPGALSTIHKKFNSAYISELIVFITVVVGIYQLNVIDSIKLSSFFILTYYAITNLSVIKLKKNQRIYSVLVAYYGIFMCIVFASSLVVL